MKITRDTFVVFAAITLSLSLRLPQEATAQELPKVPEVAGAAAQRSFQNTLGTVQRSKNYQLMGLTSKAEIKKATLGSPMPIREIGYDKLVAYREGSDPSGVFTGPEQLLYPVMVNDQVRSSITLVRDGDDWRMTTYGDAGRAQEIEKTRLGLVQQVARIGGGEGRYSLVTVPAFRLYFVAFTREGRTLLSPVSASVPAGLELQEAMEESEVVARLSAYAKDFDKKYGEEIRKRRLVM